MEKIGLKGLTSPQLVQGWIDYQKERETNPDLWKPMSTGIGDLDRLLGGGIERGQYVLIGAPQKAGKTTILLNIAKAFAKQGKSFLWLGAEMSNNQIGSMIFSNITGIERTKIRSIGLNAQDWNVLENARKEIEDYSGYWVHGLLSVTVVQEMIEQAVSALQRNLDACFIDYVQLMETPEIKGPRPEQLSYISRSLKRMSSSYKEYPPFAVIAAAQFNRESIRRGITDANSFMGTASFEQDMDIGIAISNVVDEFSSSGTAIVPNLKQLTIVGSRETETGSCHIAYNGSTATIKDVIAVKKVSLSQLAGY